MPVKLLSIFWVLLCCSTVIAQETQVFGRVSDEKGTPIPGVNVVSQEGQTQTNAAGNYALSLPQGLHEIRFSFIGYETDNRTINLVDGEAIELNVSLSPKIESLEVAVVSASRYEQRLEEVTMSMEVLKPGIIQDKNINDISLLMQQTPGVAIVDEEPQIRATSGYSFGAGSRVLVMVDGLPILSGDAGRPTWRFLPMENVNQVEVIKGASSVLYGSAAMGGVIHLRTAYPTDETLTRVNLYAGMYSMPKSSESVYWDRNAIRTGVNFLHSQKLGQWDLVFGGNTYTDEGHLGPIEEEQAFNPLEVNRFGAESRARLNANIRYRHPKISGLSFGVNTNWMKSESMATLLWDNADGGLYKAFANSATRTKQLIGNVDPFVRYVAPTGGIHELLTRWQKLDNDNDNDQSNYSDVVYATYSYTKALNENWRLTTGAMGTYTEGQSDLYNGGDANGNNTASNAAVFAQVDATFFKKWRVSGGLRYEQFRINNEQAEKPIFRFGTNYTLAKATFLRASWGQGFRFPTIAEKFIETEVGALAIYSNPEIEEETSWSAELAVKQGFKWGKLEGFADLAFFYQDYQNFIEFTFGQWLPQPSFENGLGLGFRSLNIGSSTISGAEFSLSGRLNSDRGNWTFFGGYTYARPRINDREQVYATTDADPNNSLSLNDFETLDYVNTSSDTSGVLKYRLEHLIRADVQYNYKGWGAGLSMRFNSTMRNLDKIFFTLDGPEAPIPVNTGITQWVDQNQAGDWVFDLRVMKDLGTHLRLAIQVDNLFNNEYAIRPLAIESPRITSLQLTYTRKQ